MSNLLAFSHPYPPLEDWGPALHNTILEDALYWVINEEGLIVDATPDVADAAGIPISSYIGSYADALAEHLWDPDKAERAARRERIFKTGKTEITTMWGDFPGLGRTCARVTTNRVIHPDTGRKYLINGATDITDLDGQLDYLRAPAFQNLIMLIIEKNGKVLAATNAAAKFVDAKLSRGSQLRGYTIDQTKWKSLRQREAEQVALSAKLQAPANAIEWLWSADNLYQPYAVARISFPKGRWMIVMQPVPLVAPWLQLEDISKVVQAKNLQIPKKVKETEFQTLVEYYNKINVKDLAKRHGISKDGIVKRRERLAARFGLDSVDDLLPAIKHTDLGYAVQVYADRVCADDCECDK